MSSGSNNNRLYIGLSIVAVLVIIGSLWAMMHRGGAAADLAGAYRVNFTFEDGLKQEFNATLAADKSFNDQYGETGAWSLNGDTLTVTYVTKNGHTIMLRADSCRVRCGGPIQETGEGKTWSGRFTLTRGAVAQTQTQTQSVAAESVVGAWNVAVTEQGEEKYHNVWTFDGAGKFNTDAGSVGDYTQNGSVITGQFSNGLKSKINLTLADGKLSGAYWNNEHTMVLAATRK